MKLLDDYINAYDNFHMATVIKNTKHFEMENYIKTQFDLDYWQVTQVFWYIDQIAYQTFVNIPVRPETEIEDALSKLGYNIVEGENGYIVCRENINEN